MKWSELIRSIKVEQAGGTSDPQVSDVAYDSRKVTAGSVYVAVPGFKVHGDSFIGEAISRGASAVISENPQLECGVPWIQVKEPRKVLGELARKVWGLKLYNTTMIGITGTNGKTTVAHLFRRLLGETRRESNVWMLSTVGYYLGDAWIEPMNTTPESSDVFRMMGQAKTKPSSLVMEVSSHALELNRVAGFSYDLAVWTNLTQDHLDFHQTMGEYYQAKKKLFTRYLKSRGKGVINVDDPWGSRLARELENVKKVTYGTSHTADVRIANWKCDWNGSEMDVICRGEIFHFNSRIYGQFNIYNMAALIAGAVALGIDLKRVKKVLKGFEQVTGRMERVDIEAPFSVVVDYAHTPDALENVLRTMQGLTKGRVLCVFGCGGDRDKGKRAKMADAVVKNSTEAVITNDNPRGEEPRAIIDDILEGIPLDFPHWVIVDRKEAIAKAMQLARPGDSILIAGKGHEDYQEIKGVRHHFSDRETVADIFNDFRKQTQIV